MASLKTDPAAQRILKGGVPAVPASLEFGRFLFYNSSRDAALFQKNCFDYSGQSSSPVDAMANQIKGMIKRVQGFIKMLESYATPAGIHKLRVKVEDFAIQGEQELLHVVLKQVDRTMNKVASWAKKAASRVEKEIAPLRPIIDEATKSALVEFPHDTLSDDELMPSSQHADLIDRVNAEFLYDAEEGPILHDAVLAEQDQIPDSVFGAFSKIKEMLEAFQAILPSAIDNVKLAKKTVSDAQATLHSVFKTFKGNGPPIFYQASAMYDMLWSVYFILLAVVTIGVLGYGFYANNTGSGDADGEAAIPAEGFAASCDYICKTCCCCFNGGMIGQSCFWIMLIVAQFGILLLFLVAILLCILAGVKNFIASGCSQIYILGDEAVCTETLKLIQKFMLTFTVGEASTWDINSACAKYTLMACQELGPKMATSASLTVIGGLMGAVLSFQMLVDTCINHERAVQRDKKKGD